MPVSDATGMKRLAPGSAASCFKETPSVDITTPLPAKRLAKFRWAGSSRRSAAPRAAAPAGFAVLS